MKGRKILARAGALALAGSLFFSDAGAYTLSKQGEAELRQSGLTVKEFQDSKSGGKIPLPPKRSYPVELEKGETIEDIVGPVKKWADRYYDRVLEEKYVEAALESFNNYKKTPKGRAGIPCRDQFEMNYLSEVQKGLEEKYKGLSGRKEIERLMERELFRGEAGELREELGEMESRLNQRMEGFEGRLEILERLRKPPEERRCVAGLRLVPACTDPSRLVYQASRRNAGLYALRKDSPCCAEYAAGVFIDKNDCMEFEGSGERIGHWKARRLIRELMGPFRSQAYLVVTERYGQGDCGIQDILTDPDVLGILFTREKGIYLSPGECSYSVGLE